MTLEERLKLISAGYTKNEIAAMEKPSEEKKAPEKKEEQKTPEKKEEQKEGTDFSRILAEELAKAIAATKKMEPEEKKEPEKKEPEKKEPSDDDIIKQLVAEQLKAFFQPSMKVEPVTDLSDIAKRLFEVKIKEKEGEK